MENFDLKFSTDEGNEINTALADWVEDQVRRAPWIMQHNPENYFLMLPAVVQRMIMRGFRRYNPGFFDHPRNELSRSHWQVFDRLFGYKVVTGYEMALIIYHYDAALYPQGSEAVYRVDFPTVDESKNHVKV